MISWVWKNRIKRLCSPNMWIMLNTGVRCEKFDQKVVKEMDEGTLTPLMSSLDGRLRTAGLSDGSRIWISNYPYAFGFDVPDFPYASTVRIGETNMPRLYDYIKKAEREGKYISSLDHIKYDLFHKDKTWPEYLKYIKEKNEE
jgi:hypothetical protein